IGPILMRSGLEAFQSPASQQHVGQPSAARSVPTAPTSPAAAPPQQQKAQPSADLASRERAIQSVPAPIQQEPTSQADQARSN
ncbi:hypothetical protein KQ753_15520, partial [Listeria monocytogenes]|nr:hypothetical protein [Listeria monocytogenes]